MEEGQMSELGDRVNWYHRYTPPHSLAGSPTGAPGKPGKCQLCPRSCDLDAYSR